MAPVGGNTGTTLGQQRLNALQAVANVWGATLTSVPAVLILSQFNPLACTSFGAVRGSAGPRTVFRDPSGTLLSPANMWFHAALANKLIGTDNSPPLAGDGGEEISASITPASALGLNGKIALVDRGTCTFNSKLSNVAAVGTVGMILIK